MTEGQEKTQLILLRILGILLIAVGVTLIAQQVRSEPPMFAQIANTIFSGESSPRSTCRHGAVHARRINLTEIAPAPPAPPPLPAPPAPPSLRF